MFPKNRILLLGASGRTGSEVLQYALSKGYQVNALVRDSKRIPFEHHRLQVFEGDTRIPKDLNFAMENCQAVISCLNISRKSDFP
ncbi:NAD(P)H-binding protein [Aquiflexum sp. TKW24L]|uniref:NAD(P)-dependent oxidoreductase n=1 Tax=Aquiflexum sp. TKW24L TaxID=2942212 RepID=UPI0020BDD263|nr:NAD(P)H-binding protein [Aquiflexum sp. TKW24L]MCL6257564.1 NAD(P)H-binding protein [Aquiflexum sp. TKW24L]